MFAIELDRLTKDFGPLRALDGVTAKLPKGPVGLLGPNGAGKSTLVKCLLGLVKPTNGSGRVLGIDIAGRPLSLRQQVGYLPEVDCYIPGMSAAEFTAYAGELVGMAPKEARTRAHEVLDYVGLADERYRLLDTYSTGMRQRAKLAQALVHDPEILLLDEPTNGLDPPGREQMLELVKDLSRSCGKSLIYSSHLLADVEEVCDEVIILRDGRVLAQGTLDSLRRSEDDAYRIRIKLPDAGDPIPFLSRLEEAGLTHQGDGPGRYTIRGAADASGDPVSRRVIQAAHDLGVQVRSFRPLRSSLEDVFISALEEAAGPQSTPGTGSPVEG